MNPYITCTKITLKYLQNVMNYVKITIKWGNFEKHGDFEQKINSFRLVSFIFFSKHFQSVIMPLKCTRRKK